jgi:uncharacterized membrane protein
MEFIAVSIFSCLALIAVLFLPAQLSFCLEFPPSFQNSLHHFLVVLSFFSNGFYLLTVGFHQLSHTSYFHQLAVYHLLNFYSTAM